MKCEKCESQNLQVISEYIENPDKPTFWFLTLLKVLAAFGFVIALCILMVSCTTMNDSPVIVFGILASSFAGYTLLVSFAILIIACLVKHLTPFKHTTRTRVICMDCGHSWEIPTPPLPRDENSDQF